MDALSERPPSGVTFLTRAQEELRDLREQQRQEGVRREVFGGEITDPEETTEFVDTNMVIYRGIPVEVIDPTNNQASFPHLDLVRRINTETFEDVVQEVFDEAFNLMVARQQKYGPGNIETLGQYGVFTRMEDKMERIRRSFNGKIVNGQIVLDQPIEHADESLDDADLDVMNYAAIRLLHRRGKWGKPLAAEAGFDA